MRVLAINTVGPACEVVILQNGSVAVSLTETMRQGHDRRLPNLVKEALAKTETSIRDLDLITAVTGPGSFTGVRVGVAFARGLALAHDTRSFGVTALEASLPGILEDTAKIVVALPAKKRPPEKSWWMQTFQGSNACSLPVEASENDLRAEMQGADLLAGDLDGLGGSFEPTRPSAKRAAFFAAQLPTNVLRPIIPVYVRAPDAKPMAAVQRL